MSDENKNKEVNLNDKKKIRLGALLAADQEQEVN